MSSLISSVAPVIIGSCLEISVSVTKSFWDADKLWVGLAAVFGFLLGLGVAFACSVVCIRSWQRKKQQDEEESYRMRHGIPANKRLDIDEESEYDEVEEVIVTEDQYIIDEEEDEKKKKRANMKKQKTAKEDAEEETALDDLEKSEHPHTSFLDALVQTTSDGVVFELTSQDLMEIVRLEAELWDEKITLLIFLTRKLIEKQVEKEVITHEFASDFIDRFEKQLKNIRALCQQEQKQAEEELLKRDDLKKNPSKLEKEKENLQSRTVAKMHSMLNNEKETMQRDIKKAGLSDDQLDAMMAKLTQDMEKCERHLNEEARRQALALEERLARRRHLAEKLEAEKEQTTKLVVSKRQQQSETLTTLVTDNKLLDRQRDELIEEYETNLRRTQAVQEEELQKQKLLLAEKLKKKSELRLRKLEAKQKQEREAFVNTTDKSTGKDSVLNYQDLLQQQRMERDNLINELDSEELDEIRTLRKEANEEIERAFDKEDATLMEDVENKAELSKQDVSRLMKLGQQQAEEFERVKEEERMKMNAKLKEKLAQRKQKIEEEDLKNQAEEQSTREKQENTLKIALDQQLELTEDAKNRILLEHNEHMQAMNNQLNMSRLRQRKQLEAKLNARKAKVAELKQKQEVAKLEKQAMNEKEKGKLEKELEQQIQQEEQRMEQERLDAIADLRQRLAAENEAALKEQDEKLGALIGRLQVGQARRQAIIAKQNKTLEELQDQLTNKVSENSMSLKGADQILQEHHNQVEYLTDKLQEDKVRQEKLLRERLEAKKLKREREIEETIDAESQQEWEAMRQRGAGKASNILVQMLMDQKHKAAMADLERELELDLQRELEVENKRLENKMRQDVEEQQKQFLAHLAAASNLSKTDINEVVENAVVGGGGDEKLAQKLAKELKTEVKRAKSSYGGRGEPEDEEDEEPKSRPKSSAGKKRLKSGKK